MAGLLINIDVPDLAGGIEFYSSGLGFELQRTLFQKTVAELSLDDRLVYLIEQASGTEPFPEAAQRRSYRRHWTPLHLDLVVDDLDVALESALQAGASSSGTAATHSWGKLMPLRDPFGHGLCLVEFSVRGYDAVAD